MSQGLQNSGFMREKVQKGDFLKKRACLFFCCLKSCTGSVNAQYGEIFLKLYLNYYKQYYPNLNQNQKNLWSQYVMYQAKYSVHD